MLSLYSLIPIAHAAAEPAGQPGALASMIPFLLILLFFYLLFIRPNSKKLKEHQKMISELKRGDKVYTDSGIIGKITKVTDHTFYIEVAPNTEIQVLRHKVENRYDPVAMADYYKRSSAAGAGSAKDVGKGAQEPKEAKEAKEAKGGQDSQQAKGDKGAKDAKNGDAGESDK